MSCCCFPPIAAFRERDTTHQLWPKTLLLVRHGESTYNVHYAATSQDPMNLWDAPLTACGQEQARTAAPKLAVHGQLDLALTSPLTRAIETCMLALPHSTKQATQYEVSSLMAEHLEASCDVGRAPEDLQLQFPVFDFSALPEVWWFVPDEYRAGITPERSREIFKEEGRREPEKEFHNRVTAFADFIKARKEQKIAVFAHADFFNAFLGRHSPDRKYADYWMHNCEMIVLCINGPADLDLQLPPAEPQPMPAQQEQAEVTPNAAPEPQAQRASQGLAALRQELQERCPELARVQLQKQVAAQWRALSPPSRLKYMQLSGS